MAMTAKMIKFVNEYLIDLNATQAAIRAGYSEDTAGKIGSENLQKPEIKAFLERRQQEIADAAEISPEWVIQTLVSVVNRSMQAESVLIKLDGQWVDSGEYKYDSAGANKALELIGKHTGMWPNKLDLTTKGEKVNMPISTCKLPNGDEVIL